MSELVPRDKRGQITLSKPARKQKRTFKDLLPSLDPPAGKLQPTDVSNDKFKQLIRGEGWLERQRDARFNSILVSGIAQVFVLPIGITGMLTAPAGVNVAVAGILAAFELMWVPTGVFAARVSRAKRANFTAFLQWLHGRYGITLDSKQGLVKVLSEKYPLLSDGPLQIVDDMGRTFQLSWTGYHNHFNFTPVDEREELLPLVGRSASAHSKSSKASFSPQLRQLHRQIQERLTALSDRSLSPESDHVVGRAKRDVAKIAALYADLVKFNALDDEQEAITSATLTSLIGELTEVIKKETAFSLRELAVEATYVAARQPRKGIDLSK